MATSVERPSEEMQRLIRSIAGPARAGEKDEQLRARAARRLNAHLPGHHQISDRRAKSYWYAEIDLIPSHHMDRARELAGVQGIQELADAVEHIEARVEGVLERAIERLLARRGLGDDPRVAGGAARAADGGRRVAASDGRGDPRPALAGPMPRSASAVT